MLNTREGLSDPDDFEKPFRDKLPDLEGMPPQESWDAIQTALDHDRGIDRRWYLLVLLLLVGSGGFIVGYWVSQERIEIAQAAMDGQLQTPDSRFQKDEPGQGQLLVEQDCIEVCEDDVNGPHSDGGRIAEDRNSRIADVESNENICDDVAAIGKGHSANSYTHVIRKAEESIVGDDENVVHPGYESGQSRIVSTGVKDQDAVRTTDDAGFQNADTGQAGGRGDGVESHSKHATMSVTPEYEATHGRGQEKPEGQMGSGSNDSTVQMLDGPMRPLYPHYDGVDAPSVAGVDSVQKMKEIEAVLLPIEHDSVAKNKKVFESGGWTLQLSVGGSYVFKKLTPSEDLYYVTDLTNKNKFSWSNAGYHIAARVRREIGAKTTLMAGVSWSRWQTYLGYNYYDVVADSIAVHQITANSIEVNTYFKKRSNEISTTVQQVGLSVGVLRKVQVLQRLHTVLLEASVYQKIYAAKQSAQVGHNVEVRPLHFAIKAGVEKTVDIGAWRFTLTPYIQRYLGSLYTTESVFQFSPLQVGLDVGMLLPLQKK